MTNAGRGGLQSLPQLASCSPIGWPRMTHSDRLWPQNLTAGNPLGHHAACYKLRESFL
jgi:hypothetical protein